MEEVKITGYDILKNPPESGAVIDAFILTKPKIREYRKIGCSISGGSDSDILLDMVSKLDEEKKVKYVFFNTGIEYRATKEHIRFLQEKYGVEIEEIRAKKPVPISCKQFGVPFISKTVSAFIDRLQRNGFQWEDQPFIELLEKYCEEIPESEALDESGKIKKGVGIHQDRYFKGCCAALRWWCNEFGEKSQFNISRNKFLKEFMIENPPLDINISDKCCTWAKKKPVHEWIKENQIELNIFGVRKAEGGQRSAAYKSCFTENAKGSGVDEYRPLFWLKKEDKEEYERHFEIKHSACYAVYGLLRTGCACCPFGREFEQELDIARKYEPALYKAACNIFGKSYEYTRKYRRYKEERERKEKIERSGQLSFF